MFVLTTDTTLPAGMKPQDTCLELYRRFLADSQAFALENSNG